MSNFPYSFNGHLLTEYYFRNAICLKCGCVIHWDRAWKGEELIPICPGKIQPPYSERKARIDAETQKMSAI